MPKVSQHCLYLFQPEQSKQLLIHRLPQLRADCRTGGAIFAYPHALAGANNADVDWGTSGTGDLTVTGCTFFQCAAYVSILLGCLAASLMVGIHPGFWRWCHYVVDRHCGLFSMAYSDRGISFQYESCYGGWGSYIYLHTKITGEDALMQLLVSQPSFGCRCRLQSLFETQFS